MIDAVGSCVGPRGMRVENVVNELKTEKIDIIGRATTAEYIANALNPARVIHVFVSDWEKSYAWSFRTTSFPWPLARKGRTPAWPPSSPAEDRYQEPKPGGSQPPCNWLRKLRSEAAAGT